MTATEFDRCKAELFTLADSIANAKRPGYTQDSVDVLANFKASADRLGITTMQAWGVHFEKHASAIMSRAKSSRIPQAEAIEGRFADALNYLALGYAILREESYDA